MKEVLPNGVLGVAIAGLLAAFMAGMAANVSSFNTVFTYDIWQDWVRPGREDHYYLKVGRAVTIGGCVIAIFTAYLAGSFSNLMDYIQALASFFNAPLFAIFIFGLFYKKMTGTAGWTGLLAGALAAVTSTSWSAPTSSTSRRRPAASSARAPRSSSVSSSPSWCRSSPRGRRTRSCSGSPGRRRRSSAARETVAAEDAGWFKNPVIMGTAVLILTLVLYIIWWWSEMSDRTRRTPGPTGPPLAPSCSTCARSSGCCSSSTG